MGIVVQGGSAAVAPVEVSACNAQGSLPLADLALEPLVEGIAALSPNGQQLSRVPEWMLGSICLRFGLGCAERTPPAGTHISVRAASHSVVYAVVELEQNGAAGRSGGLLPDVFSAAGWEKRAEAPDGPQGSQLAVYAKRVSGC